MICALRRRVQGRFALTAMARSGKVRPDFGGIWDLVGGKRVALAQDKNQGEQTPRI